LAISAPLVGGQIYSYANGNQAMGDSFGNANQLALGMCAVGVGGLVTAAEIAAGSAPYANQQQTYDKQNKANKPSQTPIGRQGSPMDVKPGTNPAQKINGNDYSGHAVDQMQGRGITPSVVENAIKNGVQSSGNTPGTTVHTFDNINVVTNSANKVITVITK
jgi:hypothetical protein